MVGKRDGRREMADLRDGEPARWRTREMANPRDDGRRRQRACETVGRAMEIARRWASETAGENGGWQRETKKSDKLQGQCPACKRSRRVRRGYGHSVQAEGVRTVKGW
ncbi:uncharacterized protein B0H18DRAFT_1123921 [Fomitopsis serialis]|uniref:uncharacterized protein n=1 Tax=Fomitopsis serialis TaxID=139415 RepID=UPI002008EB93|nr:uncharacterized protein B0H18DRAFT_1123921 [Neoantrodia serialis]KAH9916848.1 hypothetical protein B0H18DRAFT_1123921 [Neoantrodia serialis]